MLVINVKGHSGYTMQTTSLKVLEKSCQLCTIIYCSEIQQADQNSDAYICLPQQYTQFYSKVNLLNINKL